MSYTDEKHESKKSSVKEKKVKPKKINKCRNCGCDTTKPKFCSHNCKLKEYYARKSESAGKCNVCQKELKNSSLYCSQECTFIASQSRFVWSDCLNCGEKTRNPSYCSHECRIEHHTPKPKLVLTCKFCQKEFETTFPNQDFCSTECKERKYEVNEDYFDGPLDEEKLETLGQIIAIGQIDNAYKFNLKSDLETLEDVSRKIGSTYPMVKLKEVYNISIFSNKLILKLLEFGLIDDRLKQELPPYDIVRGMFKTHRYKSIGGGWNVFRTLSAKIAYELEWMFGGKITTKTYYTSITQDELGVEFFLIWNDDPSKHSEF